MAKVKEEKYAAMDILVVKTQGEKGWELEVAYRKTMNGPFVRRDTDEFFGLSKKDAIFKAKQMAANAMYGEWAKTVLVSVSDQYGEFDKTLLILTHAPLKTPHPWVEYVP